MKTKISFFWHLGCFSFILVFGILTIPVFSMPSEDIIAETAFAYLLQKNNTFMAEKNIFQEGKKTTELLSISENNDIPSGYLHLQNRDFLLEKQKNTPTPVFSEDVKIDRDADFFIKMDVWEYLLSFENREKGVNQYITWGKTLLSAMDYNNTQKKAQEEELKNLIKEQKKLLSKSSDIYTKAVEEGDSLTIEKQKALKASFSREISLLESQLEEITKRTKILSSHKKNIEKLVLGAEENRDALIKNVQVKAPSGEYIKAIKK